MITVRVPATSANLGAGFDSLGIALGLYNEISVEEGDTLCIESLDEVKIAQDVTNLVYMTMQDLFTLAGQDMPPVHICQRNRIPMARGLGSSSACIVGGLMAANAMLGEKFSKEELLNIAVRFEGHPDNVAPALLGGFVCAALDGKETRYARVALPEDLCYAALIPDFELATSLARSVLPRDIPRRDAVHNISRAALMAMSLISGRYENLPVATEDRLHQPYRLRLIAGADRAMEILRESGAYCAYISGAGSTLMGIVPADQKEQFAKTARAALDSAGFAAWQLSMLCADNTGAVWKKKESKGDAESCS